jgi:hypothetical protein
VAGLIIVCERKVQQPRRSAADVRRCAELILPDNIVARPPLI